MKLLDRCIQQELGKNGKKKKLKPLWVWYTFWKIKEKEVREVVYAIAIPGVLMLNIRRL